TSPVLRTVPMIRSVFGTSGSTSALAVAEPTPTSRVSDPVGGCASSSSSACRDQWLRGRSPTGGCDVLAAASGCCGAGGAQDGSGGSGTEAGASVAVGGAADRKSTRLNSSHVKISY